MATETSPSRRLPTSQLLFGLLVVLVGILVLLDTTGVFETGDLLRYAPSLLVVVGLWALVGSRFRNLVGPVVLVGVGTAWQLLALGYATWDELVVYWPVLVIAFGLSILLGQYRTGVRVVDDDSVSAFAVFGGSERRSTSEQFAGADLTAVFGGTELDLRDAEIGDRPARINAVALFGGVDIVVPREWNVRLDVIPILGGATDDRSRSADPNREVDIVVSGFVAFGGVTITD